MADKTYKLTFKFSDGTEKQLEFVSPQGEPGVSPTITTHSGPLLTQVVIKDVNGPQTFDIPNGKDGVSPTIEITEITGGNRVTVTDANGSKSFDVSNGKDGDPGAPGEDGHSPTLSIVGNPVAGGHEVSIYVDGVQQDYFKVTDGQNGDDGVSPTITITDIIGGHRVTITDKNGSQSFDVMDGEDGGSSDGSGLNHIKDGTAAGSVRTGMAALESDTYKLGTAAFAEGSATKASGNYSHAEGTGTVASNYSAHAEGTSSVASGEDSHAEGTYTIAAGEAQHVQGKYNIEDTDNKYLHIVGNGNGVYSRSNAHTLDWDGNAWFRGKVFVGGESMDDPNAKELGGDVSWNDLTDKPFGVETRTTIINETIIEEVEEQFYYQNPLDGVPVPGANYIVNWAGVSYECVGQDFSSMMGMTCIALGNTDAMTGVGDSGEPFVIVLLPEATDGDYAQIYVLNPDHIGAHIVLKIESVEVSKIPDDLLPPMPGIMFVDITGNVGGNSPDDWVANKTFMEVFTAATTGSMIFFRGINPDIPNVNFFMPMTRLDGANGVILFTYTVSNSNTFIYCFNMDNSFSMLSD